MPIVKDMPNFVKQDSLMLTVVLKYINLRVGFQSIFLIFHSVSPSVVESFNETQTKATVERFVFIA